MHARRPTFYISINSNCRRLCPNPAIFRLDISTNYSFSTTFHKHAISICLYIFSNVSHFIFFYDDFGFTQIARTGYAVHTSTKSKHNQHTRQYNLLLNHRYAPCTHFLIMSLYYFVRNYASAYTRLRIIRYYFSQVMNVMMVKDAVAQRFRELCFQRDIRINELAVLSGVTPSTVYSMLDPKRREISITTIKKLCDGLDITLSEFFTAPVFDKLEQEIK